jgi:hypothetical protein
MPTMQASLPEGLKPAKKLTWVTNPMNRRKHKALGSLKHEEKKKRKLK